MYNFEARDTLTDILKLLERVPVPTEIPEDDTDALAYYQHIRVYACCIAEFACPASHDLELPDQATTHLLMELWALLYRVLLHLEYYFPKEYNKQLHEAGDCIDTFFKKRKYDITSCGTCDTISLSISDPFHTDGDV